MAAAPSRKNISGMAFGSVARVRQSIIVVWLLLSAGAACDSGRNLSPLSPSDVLSDPRLASEMLAQWSPYVGIHVTGEAQAAYRDAVSALQSAGRLRGARIEISRSLSPADPTYRTIRNTGIELLGLVSNEFLFSANIEQEIDQIFAAFPEIRHLQIGNEVTTILPASGPTITIEQYMTLFRRIYDHVQNRHPGRATLLTQSTLLPARGARSRHEVEGSSEVQDEISRWELAGVRASARAARRRDALALCRR